MINKRDRRSGFTLIELVVVVLIIGILAAVGLPSYMKTLETTKADDAVALVNMIGTTNKMFALDHSGVYVTGAFPSAANGSCSAAGLSCSPLPASPWNNGCYLVACKYLSDQNFGSKPYVFNACNPVGACGSGGTGTADAKHKAIGDAAYQTWGYTQSDAGIITAYGGAPAATY